MCNDGFVHMSAGARASQKGVPDPLGLQLQVITSRLLWMLGSKFQPYKRAVRALNH